MLHTMMPSFVNSDGEKNWQLSTLPSTNKFTKLGIKCFGITVCHKHLTFNMAPHTFYSVSCIYKYMFEALIL